MQFDCFHVGRLSGTKGTVWQYTAIDVASAWAELYVTPRNPAAKWTSRLARRVAADLAARGWELETVMTDNGSEFRSRQFGAAVAELGAEQRFIRAGRPQTKWDEGRSPPRGGYSSTNRCGLGRPKMRLRRSQR